MSRTIKMKSLMRNLRAVFHQYLHEITIHGLRYLIDGRNWFEVAARGTVITLCFILSFAGVYTSINESIKNQMSFFIYLLIDFEPILVPKSKQVGTKTETERSNSSKNRFFDFH